MSDIDKIIDRLCRFSHAVERLDDGWEEMAVGTDDAIRAVREAVEAERGRIRRECRSDLLEAMRESRAYDDIEHATAPWPAGERITTPTGDDDE